MFFCVVLKWVRMRIKARRRNFWSFLCSQNGLSWRQTRIKDHFWRLCEIPAAEFSYFTLTENFMSEKKPLWAGTSSIAADIISCPKSSNWWGDTFSSNFGKVKVASVWWNFAVNPMFLSVTFYWFAGWKKNPVCSRVSKRFWTRATLNFQLQDLFSFFLLSILCVWLIIKVPAVEQNVIFKCPNFVTYFPNKITVSLTFVIFSMAW